MARLKDRVKAAAKKKPVPLNKTTGKPPKAKFLKPKRQPMANWSKASEKSEPEIHPAPPEAPVMVKQVKDDPQAAKLEKALAANAKQTDELTRLRKENESLNVLRNSLEKIGENHAEVGEQLKDAVAKSNV